MQGSRTTLAAATWRDLVVYNTILHSYLFLPQSLTSQYHKMTVINIGSASAFETILKASTIVVTDCKLPIA